MSFVDCDIKRSHMCSRVNISLVNWEPDLTDIPCLDVLDYLYEMSSFCLFYHAVDLRCGTYRLMNSIIHCSEIRISLLDDLWRNFRFGLPGWIFPFKPPLSSLSCALFEARTVISTPTSWSRRNLWSQILWRITKAWWSKTRRWKRGENVVDTITTQKCR